MSIRANDVRCSCSGCSLAQKQPGLLDELQGQAKVWSNEGLIRVVFVLSDGAGLPQMKRVHPPRETFVATPSRSLAMAHMRLACETTTAVLRFRAHARGLGPAISALRCHIQGNERLCSVAAPMASFSLLIFGGE